MPVAVPPRAPTNPGKVARKRSAWVSGVIRCRFPGPSGVRGGPQDRRIGRRESAVWACQRSAWAVAAISSKSPGAGVQGSFSSLGHDAGRTLPRSPGSAPAGELPRPFDRLLARADLAGEARLLELVRGSRPSSRPGRSPTARASSSPRSGRPRPVRTPGQRLAQQLAGQLEVPGDRLVGASPARGQPVGDAEQRHVDLRPARRRAGSGRSPAGSSGISWTRKPRRRWWRVSAATCSRSRSLARRRVSTAAAISAPPRRGR